VLTWSVRITRPAAGNRRRFSYRAALLGIAVLVASCAAPPPAVDAEAARRAGLQAARTVREHDPRRAAYLEELIALADVATTTEAAAPAWRRSPGRVEAAWLRVAVEAGATARAAHRRLATEREAYEALIEIVEAEVARAQAEIRETGMGPRAGAAIARAKTAVDTARRLAAGGHYERARATLQKASEAADIVHQTWIGLHSRFADPRLRRQWNRWVELTVEDSRRNGTTSIVIDKLRRELVLYHAGRKVATYPAELGANGLRRKEVAGDRATPEGIYRVTRLKQGRDTIYYKALLINYPNDDDRMRFELGRRRGTISRRTGIGSLIEIHGDGGEGTDWTDGCVALRNDHMDQVFARSRVGMTVTIVGTHGR
jgi:lipoprotein-anchoring transpeptidase ErfK/SrfK